MVWRLEFYQTAVEVSQTSIAPTWWRALHKKNANVDRTNPLPVTCVHFATSGTVCNCNLRPAHSHSLKGHDWTGYILTGRRWIRREILDQQDSRFQSSATQSPFKLLIQTILPTKWSWIDQVWSKKEKLSRHLCYLAVIRRWENITVWSRFTYYIGLAVWGLWKSFVQFS